MATQADQTKTILTSLITSHPQRWTIRQLCDEFRATVGYAIPIRQMGFNTFEQYFQSIPDTIQVFGTGPNAEVQGIIKPKSAHINLLVSKQKNAKIPPSQRRRIANYVSRPQQPSYSNARNRWNTPTNSTNNYYGEQHSQVRSSEYLAEDDDDFDIGTQTFSNLQIRRPECIPKEYDQNFNIGNQTLSNEPVRSPEYIANDYDHSFKREIQTNSLPEERPFVDDYKSKVPPEIQNNLRKLILLHPDGIWCSKFPEEYRKLFRKGIHYERYEYRSLIEMCCDLPEIFQYAQPSSDDFIIYDRNTAIPPLNQNETETQLTNGDKDGECSSLNVLENLTILDDCLNLSTSISDNVMSLSDEIPRIPLEMKAGDLIDIVIGEIYDLSKFWVYLAFGELNSLMDNLRIFFETEKNKYFIPEVLLTEGLYCCALYLGEYHRVVIINLLPKIKGFVRVLYIDYGTVGNVSINELWFLPKQFGSVPSQAIRARLSNIYPSTKNTTWNVETIQKFRDLISGGFFVGEITKIDREDQTVEIYLADITDQTNIFYINDTIVKAGYAIYTDQPQKEGLTDPNCTPIVQYVHLFPEFCDIESGYAPNAEEMKYIVEKKIPMHHYFPQYFNISYEEDIDYIEATHEEWYKTRPCAAPNLTETKFDYSFFPSALVEQIRHLKKSYHQETLEQDSRRDLKALDGETKGRSVTEYRCNKQRFSALMSETLLNDSARTPSDIGSSRSSSEADTYSDIDLNNQVSPNNSFKAEPLDSSDYLEANLSSFSSGPVFNNSAKVESLESSDYLESTLSQFSTNPFLNGSLTEYTKSRACTNPFLTEIESKLLEVSKPPDSLPNRIVNNLNCSECCKQVNKTCIPDNSMSAFGSSGSGFTPEALPAKPRTPPGFTSLNSTQNATVNTNIFNNLSLNQNMIFNNPYYRNASQQFFQPPYLYQPVTNPELPGFNGRFNMNMIPPGTNMNMIPPGPNMNLSPQAAALNYLLNNMHLGNQQPPAFGRKGFFP